MFMTALQLLIKHIYLLGKISIKDVLLSPILTEFFELRQPGLPQQYLKSNWFSPHSTLRVYGKLPFVLVDTLFEK